MVTYWDTSALVPLLIREPRTEDATALAKEGEMVTWWGTVVECTSAIARREREGQLSAEDADELLQRLSRLHAAWVQVVPTDEVRNHAERLLRRHPLRAADALQLGAALTWAGGRPGPHRIATLDERLWRAARGEGFVLPLVP